MDKAMFPLGNCQSKMTAENKQLQGNGRVDLNEFVGLLRQAQIEVGIDS